MTQSHVLAESRWHIPESGGRVQVGGGVFSRYSLQSIEESSEGQKTCVGKWGECRIKHLVILIDVCLSASAFLSPPSKTSCCCLLLICDVLLLFSSCRRQLTLASSVVHTENSRDWLERGSFEREILPWWPTTAADCWLHQPSADCARLELRVSRCFLRNQLFPACFSVWRFSWWSSTPDWPGDTHHASHDLKLPGL